jgi:hypothetical protein
MPEVYVKSSRRDKDLLVAVCDAELLGKTLQGGHIPFIVRESFYKGTPAELDEAIGAMKHATICNIVGKKIVKAAIENQMVHEAAVIYFGEVPHAQIIIL